MQVRIRLSRKRRGLGCGIRVNTHGKSRSPERRSPELVHGRAVFRSRAHARRSVSFSVGPLCFFLVPTSRELPWCAWLSVVIFLDGPIMSVQAGARVRTARPTSEPQGWLLNIFLTWETECQCA